MAHYAKVVDGKVTNVIVAEAEYFDTFVDDSPGTWIQTSYNTYGGVHYENGTNKPSKDQGKALRYNYAGVGFNYDKNADAFYSPQPYSSWKLNTTSYVWEAPVKHPNDGKLYEWNEEKKSWDLVE